MAAERGYTLVELMVVLLIIGLIVVIAIPNMMRARIRATMLAQMKQVREACMVARIQAIRGGRQTVLRIDGPTALLAWVDENGDEAYDPGEQIVRRWQFSEKVTVSDDSADSVPALPLRPLGITAFKGVVFLANGMASPSASNGAGQGAFLVNDFRGNRFRVTIWGGAGSVIEEMWDPDASKYVTKFLNWRY